MAPHVIFFASLACAGCLQPAHRARPMHRYESRQFTTGSFSSMADSQRDPHGLLAVFATSSGRSMGMPCCSNEQALGVGFAWPTIAFRPHARLRGMTNE